MTARAYVEKNRLYLRGVTIHMARESIGGQEAFDFANVALKRVAEDVVPDVTPLSLSDDEARALYGALGDYFGHSGTDTRALRQDYDAERARVDRLIGLLAAARGETQP